jgi:hypothetical protein
LLAVNDEGYQISESESLQIGLGKTMKPSNKKVEGSIFLGARDILAERVLVRFLSSYPLAEELCFARVTMKLIFNGIVIGQSYAKVKRQIGKEDFHGEI